MDQKSMKEAYERMYPSEAVKKVRDEMQQRYRQIIRNYKPEYLKVMKNERTGEVRYFGKYSENKKG